MSTYRVSTGHDVALGSLTVLDPQPRSTGVQVSRRVPSGDGSVTDQGLFVELVFSMLPTASDYTTILTNFGLNAATSANVTVYVRDERWSYARYNGLAILPNQGDAARWNNYFPRNITILIRNLEAL